MVLSKIFALLCWEGGTNKMPSWFCICLGCGNVIIQLLALSSAEASAECINGSDITGKRSSSSRVFRRKRVPETGMKDTAGLLIVIGSGDWGRNLEA